jgi:hypothetical protein
MADMTVGTLVVTKKIILKTSKADPYTEIQWHDEKGEVIAQIVAHLDVHSGRSAPHGGHLSFYVRDTSLSEGRRGLIDIDTATDQNDHSPAMRLENVSPALRDGSAIFQRMGDGTWYRLDRASDGRAVWTKASPPAYP